MLTASTMRDYQRHRRDGNTVPTAYALAKRAERIRGLDYSIEDGESFDVDEFTCTITIEPDDDCDLSWLGEWTDDTDGTMARRSPDSGCYKRFRPAEHRNLDEYRAGCRNAGMSRHASWLKARKYMQRDLELMEELSSDGMWYVGVTVSRDDVELGHSGIGGVDREWIKGAYLEYNLLGEALKDARTTLASLCRSRTAV